MTSQLRKYKKVKYLGKGSYGAAILVELKSNPAQTFVIKEIVIGKLLIETLLKKIVFIIYMFYVFFCQGHLKPAEQQAAKNEAEVLHQMAHSNITMYIESFVENSKLYIGTHIIFFCFSHISNSIMVVKFLSDGARRRWRLIFGHSEATYRV